MRCDLADHHIINRPALHFTPATELPILRSKCQAKRRASFPNVIATRIKARCCLDALVLDYRRSVRTGRHRLLAAGRIRFTSANSASGTQDSNPSIRRKRCSRVARVKGMAKGPYLVTWLPRIHHALKPLPILRSGCYVFRSSKKHAEFRGEYRLVDAITACQSQMSGVRTGNCHVSQDRLRAEVGWDNKDVQRSTAQCPEASPECRGVRHDYATDNRGDDRVYQVGT